MVNNIKSSSDIADEIIDSRVVNTLWDYINNIGNDIKAEVTKAGYILGFQGTILFVASAQIGGLGNILPKILLMCSFIISAVLSFLVIAGKRNINIISLNNIRFDRGLALTELKEIYKIEEKLLRKKILLNNINIIIQVIMLISVLAILLFGNQLK